MNDETNEPNDKERQEMIRRILEQAVARGEVIKKVDPVTGETLYKYNEVSETTQLPPRDQAAREMYQLIGHLDRIDADIVVENAKAIVRERGTAMLKEFRRPRCVGPT